MTRAARFLSPALAVFLLGVCVYRAATQSITHDEARAYLDFYSGGPLAALTVYDAGNHVLQSLLSAAAVWLFGFSEFTLRLPAVAGAVLYLLVAWRMSVWLFGAGWRAALTVALLGLNPFVLDYLAAARGYGIGLGLLLAAVYEAARYLEEGGPARLYRAGIASGLAIAATLVFVYPVAALAAMVAALAGRKRFWTVVDGLAGPALVTAFVILALPLTRLPRGAFYYGAATLRDSVFGVVAVSWLHDNAFLATRVEIALLQAIAVVLAPALVAGAAVLSLRRKDKTLALVTGMLLLTIVLAIATNWILGLRYPAGRTAIYWAPLFALAAALMFDRLARAGRRIAAGACLAFLIGSVALFAAGFTVSYFSEWRYDAGTKRIALRLKEMPRRPRRLGASWELAPSLNFYRLRYGISWIAPVDRGGPDRDFDYYVLAEREWDLAKKRRLKVLYTDPVSKERLAEPARAVVVQ